VPKRGGVGGKPAVGKTVREGRRGWGEQPPLSQKGGTGENKSKKWVQKKKEPN